MSVNITDNSQKFNDEMLKKIENVLWTIGETAEGYAKDNTPVDTGRLRNSITHAEKIDEQSTYIGTNVEYAPYVEAGSSHNTAHHMLRDACQNHTDEYKAIAKAALKA